MIHEKSTARHRFTDRPNRLDRLRLRAAAVAAVAVAAAVTGTLPADAAPAHNPAVRHAAAGAAAHGGHRTGYYPGTTTADKWTAQVVDPVKLGEGCDTATTILATVAQNGGTTVTQSTAYSWARTLTTTAGGSITLDALPKEIKASLNLNTSRTKTTTETVTYTASDAWPVPAGTHGVLASHPHVQRWAYRLRGGVNHRIIGDDQVSVPDGICYTTEVRCDASVACIGRGLGSVFGTSATANRGTRHDRMLHRRVGGRS
ncbi:hypothetical protein [Kitasatospora sp. NPDC059827]|uniref:hypothetical protein n=1 Tax=Kitasatospora sp. NPDC059827 TaxID=3346964 RepID=UPI00365222E3